MCIRDRYVTLLLNLLFFNKEGMEKLIDFDSSTTVVDVYKRQGQGEATHYDFASSAWLLCFQPGLPVLYCR